MGFMAIDYASEKFSVKVKKSRCRALVGETVIDGRKVILAKPQTYMNLSGESIRDLLEYYDIGADSLVVIYDDMDLELGKVRIRKKGGSGSHNGMKSILYHLGDESFARIRLGIGSSGEEDAVRFVTSRFPRAQREEAFAALGQAVLAIEEIVRTGIDSAMNKHNK